MPDNSSNATSLRTSGHTTRVYMSYLGGSQVLVAALTATPASPVKSLSISITSGNISDVVRGYRYTIESSGGDWKGAGSVRAAGTLNSTNLPVREISAGSIKFVTGDVVRVYDDVALGDRLVEDTSDFDPDGLAVSDNTSNPPPVVISGGHWAGWLPASGTLALSFRGDESYTIDPDSSGTVTHLWTATSGTWDDNTTANPTLTLTETGKVRVTHTVTDSSNSKLRTQYIRVRVHDENDPPYECIIEEVNATPLDGWNLSVRLFENATLSELPDSGMVAIWTSDRVGSTELTFGAPVTGRGHILMVGFLARDTNIASLSFPQIRFDVISPLAKLAALPGFSKVFIRDQSPDAWSKTKSLTFKRAIVQLIAFYTWLIESGFDLIFNGFTDTDYKILFLNKDTPLGQWTELAKARLARIVCLKNGRIEVQGLLSVVALEDRASITKTYTVSPDDVIEDTGGGVEFIREHDEPLETFRLQGFIGHPTDPSPFFARFPQSPGTGNLSEVRQGAVVTDISRGFLECAMLGARFNQVFMNGDGHKFRAPVIENIRFIGAYWRILDFYREYIAFSEYGASTNLRGVDLTTFLWELEALSVEFDSGVAITTSRLQAETAGKGAVDDTPPASVTDDLVDWSLIWNPISFETFVPTGDWDGNNQLPVKMWGISYTNPIDVARSVSFNPATHAVTYEDLGDMGGVITGLGMWGCSDPHNYFRKFILTTTGLWKIEDLWVGSPVATLVASNATMFGASDIIGHKVMMTHNDKKGWILVLTGTSSCAVSFDYGATWAQRNMDGGAFSGGTSTTPSLVGDAVICGWNSSTEGWIYGTFGNPFGSNVRMCKSTNWGLTWSVLWTGNPNVFSSITNPGRLHVPYLRQDGSQNRNNTSLEIFGQWGAGNVSGLVLSSAAGATAAGFALKQSSNAAGQALYASAPSPRRSVVFTHDATRVWSLGNSSDSLYFSVSDDGMSTILRSGVIAADGAIASINGFSVHRDFAVVFAPGDTAYGTGAGAVHYTDDGGQNWYNIVPSFFGNARCAYFEGDLSDFIPQRG